MMAQTIALDIPTGFRISNRQKTVDYVTACELLSSKKQRYYKKAEKQDRRIVLYWQKIKCPNCGSEFSPYRFTRTVKNRIPQVRIYEWTGFQLSLFNNNRSSILYIGNDFDGLNWSPVCLKCGCRASVSENSEKVIIESDNDTIQISRVSHKENTVSERITFDFKTGETTFINPDCTRFKERSDEKNYFKRKINEKVGALENLLSNNAIVKRKLRRLFQEKWAAKIPYADKDLTLEKFALMTRFINFNRRFYDAIPFDVDSTNIEKSFEYVANELRDEQSVIRLLKESMIPDCKSVRRLFFQHPEWIFYLRECEFLYGIIEDINLFCKAINCNDIIQVLICIHIYPLTKEFYKDFLNTIGKRHFCDWITTDINYINRFAREYCALSDYGKEREQMRWKKEVKNLTGSNLWSVLYVRQNFSTLMHPVNEEIRDCIVNGYSFQWLRSKYDYAKAGEQLGNCLKLWSAKDLPVVAVYFNSKIVAAIEVCNREVIQAYKAHNERIEEDSALGKVITKWKKKNHLTSRPDCPDDLPY